MKRAQSSILGFSLLFLAGGLRLPAQVPAASLTSAVAASANLAAAGPNQNPDQNGPSAQAKKPHRHDNGSFLTPKTERSGNLVAAEDEDDKAVYRHSASVRAIGSLLHLDPESAARLFEYINFALLAGGLLIFLLKYLPARMKAQRQTIQKDLLEARSATEQANARLAAVEEKFARLDQEIADIRSQAEREGAAEENRMKALMETERQRIIAAAEQEISAAGASARRELKRFAAGLAVDRAAQKISVDKADDRNLIRQFVQDLKQTGREGRN